jgi:hypothetical protein
MCGKVLERILHSRRGILFATRLVFPKFRIASNQTVVLISFDAAPVAPPTLSCGPRLGTAGYKAIQADRQRGLASPFQIQDLKMSSSDQLRVCDSAHVRGDTETMFGIGPRICRIFEFAAAGTGVVLLAPIFLVTAIAIKLESRGPIFIREPQFGRRNRVIQLLKFRFVRIGSWQRPTRVGLVPGRTGLDQLPQVCNVLRGEMSLADLLRAIGRDGVFLP